MRTQTRKPFSSTCLAGDQPVPLTPNPESLPTAGIIGRPAVDVPEIREITIPIARESVRRTKLDPSLVVTAGPISALAVEPEPRLLVRVRAVIAYDEGTTPPLTIAQARERVAALVENANKDMEGTGVRLVFFPRADIEFREDTKLRRDADLGAGFAKLPTLSEAEGQKLIDAAGQATFLHRNAVAAEKPNRMLWLFSRGNRFEKKTNAKGQFVSWNHIDDRGGSFSGGGNNFVALHEAIISTLQIATGDASRAVHETGHYMNLAHTHREPWHDEGFFVTADQMKTLSFAERFALWKKGVEGELAKKLRAGATAQSAAAFYDSDRGNVLDTPADPGAGIIALANAAAGNGSDAWGPVESVKLSVTGIKGAIELKPLRDNPMSYFLDDGTAALMRFTPGQAKVIRDTLTNQRRPLVAAQLGDTATPDLRVCAVWSPNAKAQRVTWGNSLAGHQAEHNKMRSQGMALAQVQAYTRNGAVQYDGIWNPGTQTQAVALGWLDSDVKADQGKRALLGLRPVRVQGYQHLDHGIRYNVIYEKGSGSSQILLGVTQDVLFDEYEKAKKKGMRMVSLNSHVENGQARYSSVFRTSNIAQSWVSGWTLADIVKRYDDEWKAGFKIREISVVKLSAGHRWTALFEPDPAGQLVFWAHVRERITEVYDEQWAQDSKLRSMCVVSA